MYGSASRWRVKEGKQQELETVAKLLMSDRPPGAHRVVIYRSDSDPREYSIAGSWESREAYHGNSSSPEQQELFRNLRDLMDGDPEWHDGEIVASY
jgi:quinol monooxygenase YgiN